MFWIALPLLFLRYALHLFYYFRSSQKEIIKQEVIHVLVCYKVNLSPIIGLIWALHRNPYFLTLFYYRIGQSRAYLCSFFKQESSTLEIYCEQMGTTKMFHPFSAIVNAKRIGNNFEFRNNTTIGNKNDDYNLRPEIGNNVTLGANVMIFGDITIGDNVIVGAGTVINKDIPSNCVVVGNPFRIIKSTAISNEKTIKL